MQHFLLHTRTLTAKEHFAVQRYIKKQPTNVCSRANQPPMLNAVLVGTRTQDSSNEPALFCSAQCTFERQ
jgi:hypothetical protein